MTAFIDPPQRIPLLLRLGIKIAELSTGKPMLPARLLSWVPKTAIGAGLLEALVIHRDPTVSLRLLKLVRMQTSFFVSCPFCIDMNAFQYQQFHITTEEIQVLQNKTPIAAVATFDERERLALEYVRAISQTPIALSSNLVARLQRAFTAREIVVLAGTVAQVNYWARLIQGLGIPPAGFSTECRILEVDRYQTVHPSKEES